MVIVLSLQDQSIKELVRTEYIRLNNLYRARAKKFCCLSWGVHVFPPFEISTNPILDYKFKVEILRLNEFDRQRCELCWNNDVNNSNKKYLDEKVAEVNLLFSVNYRMADEAKRINEDMKLNLYTSNASERETL